MPEWSHLRFQDGELDKVFDALFLDCVKGEVGQPEKVEKKAIFLWTRNVATTYFNQDQSSDDNKGSRNCGRNGIVLEKQDDDEGKDTLLWKPFAQAVTNYYLQVQDPVNGTLSYTKYYDTSNTWHDWWHSRIIQRRVVNLKCWLP